MNPVWIAIPVTLIGGGAVGALITAYVTHRRSSKQPIGYTEEIIHIFREGQNFPRLAKLIVAEHPFGVGTEKPVNNLSLARIILINKGNQDLDEFAFGITMEGPYKVVDVRMKDPDRHHKMRVSIEEEVPLINPDFSLTPFNRGDEYGVDIYFTYEQAPGLLKLSTSHPCKFIEMSKLNTLEHSAYHLEKLLTKVVILLMFLLLIPAISQLLSKLFGL
jgi:hypothetical protein